MDALVCTTCSHEYPLHDPIWRCQCGGLLDIRRPVEFAEERHTRSGPSLWRYFEALPLDHLGNIISIGEGDTACFRMRLLDSIVRIKSDHVNPSGSFKDRGAAVVISHAKEIGIRHVVEDSSGNAGAAIACHCALAGIKCDVYVPEKTSAAKAAQILMYGAGLIKVPGTREDTALAAQEAGRRHYYVGHAWNPFFLHGTKTCAFEIVDHYEDDMPDTVIVPVGNGTLYLGLYIGFKEMRAAGLLDRIPKLVGVQAMECAPLARAFGRGEDEPSGGPVYRTMATGIAVANPVRGRQILHVARETGGEIMWVNEGDIHSALIDLCRKGIYVEPTSAVAWAGAFRYLQRGHADEKLLFITTGHGLKATDKMQRIIKQELSED